MRIPADTDLLALLLASFPAAPGSTKITDRNVTQDVETLAPGRVKREASSSISPVHSCYKFTTGLH